MEKIPNFLTPLTKLLLFESCKLEIESLHFKIEPFGTDTVVVREIPVIFDKINISDWLLKFLSDYTENEFSIDSVKETLKPILEMKACKAAIKAGQTLSEGEVKSLIYEMLKSPNNYTCPHGRPLVIHFDKNKLETLFSRR